MRIEQLFASIGLDRLHINNTVNIFTNHVQQHSQYLIHVSIGCKMNIILDNFIEPRAHHSGEEISLVPYLLEILYEIQV